MPGSKKKDAVPLFSQLLENSRRLAERVGQTPPLPPGDFSGLLESASRRPLADDELVELINGTRSEANGRAAIDFAAACRRPHDREILLLPPLYFSSICENTCRYCNFRQKGQRLGLAEFEREFSFLVGLGFRSIELVSSQDPEIFRRAGGCTLDDQRFAMDAFLPYLRAASGILAGAGGGMLTSNIPPVDGDSLRVLRENGLDCFLVWQETFDPGQYGRLHTPTDLKGRQHFRLDSMQRAVAAGIPHLAGAFLKGLYDWRKEEVLLYLFDRHLKSLNGRGFSIIGTPRVKGPFSRSPLIRRYQVADGEYEVNLALDRILFDGILWLQTREPFAFNRSLIRRLGGGVILTLACSTAPGGYAVPAASPAQFPVFNEKVRENVELLAEDGLTVHFAWDRRVLESFQRTQPGTGPARAD